MKTTKLILTGLALFSYIYSYAQAPTVSWFRSQGGTDDDFVNGVVETSDGNYVFSGSTMSNDGDLSANSGNRDGWIYKVDKNTGVILSWGGNFGGASSDQVQKVIELSNTDVTAIGAASSNTITGYHAGGELYIVQLDATGALIFDKCYGGTGSNEWGDDVCEAQNGNLVFVGKTDTPNDGDLLGLTQYGSTDLWVAEIDKNFPYNIVAGRNIRIGGLNAEDFGNIEATSDGGYIVSCRTKSSDGMVMGCGYHALDDAWIIKLDSTLNIQWKKCYGGSQNDVIRQVLQDTDGNYVLAGQTNSIDGDLTGVTNRGSNDYWILKIDSGGTHDIIWQKTMGGSLLDNALSCERAVDGGYLICGRSFSTDSNVTVTLGGGDCWIAKLNAFNPAGNLDWVITNGGSDYDGANYIIQASDSSIVVAGEGRSSDDDISTYCPGCFHNPQHALDEESYTYRLIDSTLYNTADVVQQQIQIGVSIYPNPFSYSTTIQLFTDLKIENANLALFDALGKQVMTISGINSYNIKIERGDLSTGTYFCQLTMGNQVLFSKKLLIQ